MNIFYFFSDVDAVTVFNEAKRLKIIGKDFIWISNQQSITGEALKYAPQGTTFLYVDMEWNLPELKLENF